MIVRGSKHKSGLKLITRLSKAYAGQNREGLRQPMLTIQFFYFEFLENGFTDRWIGFLLFCGQRSSLLKFHVG